MRLVVFLSVHSLTVHLRDVVLIPLAHFIESADEVVSLLGQIGELLVQRNLMFTVPNLSVTKVI